MRQIRWLRLATLLCVLCLGAWPICTRTQQQGSEQQSGTDAVADAARKAREQKKNEPKPKKVYTDDDVRLAPVTPPAQSATAEAKAGAEGGDGSAKVAKEGTKEVTSGDRAEEEKKWRKKFKEMHGKIAQAEQELSILQRELDRGQVQYYTDPTKAMKEQNNRKEINDKTDQINAKKKEIEQLKQQVSDMEDELRRAGGDIGWSRE